MESVFYVMNNVHDFSLFSHDSHNGSLNCHQVVIFMHGWSMVDHKKHEHFFCQLYRSCINTFNTKYNWITNEIKTETNFEFRFPSSQLIPHKNTAKNNTNMKHVHTLPLNKQTEMYWNV